MGVGDHYPQPLLSSIPVVADYSYHWYFKMYHDVAIPSRCVYGWVSRSWKITDIQYPSQLIVYTCFSGHSSQFAGINMGAFPDGHAEAVSFDRLFISTLGGQPYNLDWTRMGALGRDVK